MLNAVIVRAIRVDIILDLVRVTYSLGTSSTSPSTAHINSALGISYRYCTDPFHLNV